MSALAEDLRREEVDAAMESWVRWAKSALHGVGWSGVNLLWRVIKFGALGAARQAGIRVVEVDQLCELVDTALLRLPEDERRVIVRQYWYYESLKVTARESHIGYDRCRKLLGRARRSVADYLDGAKLKYAEGSK